MNVIFYAFMGGLDGGALQRWGSGKVGHIVKRFDRVVVVVVT